MKTTILGIGTGRCGSQSLATLLNGCQNANISHEFRERGDKQYRLSWYFNKEEADRRIKLIKELKGQYVGDVAHYYLNYIKYFKENIPNLKIILLTRNINETIESFMKKTEQVGHRCHWLPKWHPDMIKHGWKQETWTRTFPQFIHAKDKKDAIKMYCEAYYRRALAINNVFIMPVKKLNDNSILDYMYNAIGIKKEDRNYNSIWENRYEKEM